MGDKTDLAGHHPFPWFLWLPARGTASKQKHWAHLATVQSHTAPLVSLFLSSLNKVSVLLARRKEAFGALWTVLLITRQTFPSPCPDAQGYKQVPSTWGVLAFFAPFGQSQALGKGGTALVSTPEVWISPRCPGNEKQCFIHSPDSHWGIGQLKGACMLLSLLGRTSRN